LVSKSGFAISGDNFVWTERGLLKVTELSPDDNIMGINRVGKTSWSSITLVKTKKGKILRITTDSNESLLAPECEIFTVEGIRQASNVSIGDLVETANIPLEILETLDKKALQSIRFDDHKIELDEKYDRAVELVIQTGQASISMIQRKLRVGYNRAARMIEAMEKNGLVGPSDGVRPREVYGRREE